MNVSAPPPAVVPQLRLPWRVLWFVLLFLLILPSSHLRADSTVTNCTHQALVAALAAGGTVTFTNTCSLTLANTITITNDVVIDSGGHSVTISGNNSFRLFTVQPGFNFTLKGLTL